MADVPGYAAYVPGYPMSAPGYATLSGLRRGPESCGSKSRGSRGSSDRSLTRSEQREALRGVTADLVGDITQEIREKLEPLIPPQGSPTALGASSHRLQANHLVAGLSHTLGGVRSRPMPTPAVLPRSPFVPRTAQPPYSHMANSTRAELDQLGLTALRAIIDVEPYGSCDLGGNPSDDEPPSLTSASPSDDDDPEDPDCPREKKMKKKKKSRRHRSQDAKAVATSKIVVNLPEFTRKDLSGFAESFARLLRITGQTHASRRFKCNLLLQCCKTKYLEKQVKRMLTKSATLDEVLVALERQYPCYETDLSIRTEMQNLGMLPNNPKGARITELLADLDHWVGWLTPGSYGSDELLFWLVAKIPTSVWAECRATAERKARTLTYEDLSVLLLELALEKESHQHLDAYRPGGGGSGSHGKGYQGPRFGQGTTPKHARIMGNVQELFWCDARDEHGHLQHAPDCDPSAPQGVGGELPPPAGGGLDAAGRMGSHAGRCAPPPGSPPLQPPRAPGPPVCPQAPAGDPPGDAARRHPPVGHHPKPSPAQTHPLTTPQASAHRHRRHPQHPRSPARHTTRRA